MITYRQSGSMEDIDAPKKIKHAVPREKVHTMVQLESRHLYS